MIFINLMVYSTQDQVIPGSGVLVPNASYELTKILQKQKVSLDINPAYDTVPVSPISLNQIQEFEVASRP